MKLLSITPSIPTNSKWSSYTPFTPIPVVNHLSFLSYRDCWHRISQPLTRIQHYFLAFKLRIRKLPLFRVHILVRVYTILLQLLPPLSPIGWSRVKHSPIANPSSLLPPLRTGTISQFPRGRSFITTGNRYSYVSFNLTRP